MTPLLPVALLVLGSGALLFSLLPRSPFAAPTAVGTMAAAWLAVLALGLDLPARVVLSAWAPAGLLPVGLVLEANGPNWLLAAGLTTTSLAVILTGLSRPGGRRLAPRGAVLLLTAAGLAALMAGNLLTLVTAWAGLDLLYFAILILLARGEGIQPQAVLHLTFNSIGTLAALGAVLLIGRASPQLTWQAASASPNAVVLMTIAAAFRLGLFPLHLGLPVEANVRQGLGTLLRLVPATVALQAVAQLAAVGIPDSLRPWLTVFGVAAALVGGVQLWNADDPRQGLTFAIIAQSGLALLAGLWAGGQAMAVVTVMALGMVLGAGLVFLANGLDETRPWFSAWPGLGAWVLAGGPLGVGFAGLGPLWSAWLASGHWGLGLALAGVGVAMILIVGGLLRAVAWPGEPIEGGVAGQVGYHLGLGALALTALAGGLLPGAVLRLAGAPAEAAAHLPPAGGWGGLVGVLACLAGGAALWRFENLARARTEAAAEALASALRLEWLYRWLWGAVGLLGRLVNYVAGVLEGEGALLWAMVVTVVILLLVRP